MNHLKQELIESAKRIHTRIFPCKNYTDVEECFTVEGSQLLFWFNTEDNSTHLLTKEI